MIESRYWKDDLLKLAKELKPEKHPKRWPEKRQVNFEKEIIISFFKIRKLFETRYQVQAINTKQKSFATRLAQRKSIT